MALDIVTMTPTQIILRLASASQEKLQQLSIQISSGEKHQDFKGFAEDATTEKFLGFGTALGNIDTYISANNAAISRAKAENSSLQTLQEAATDLAALITQRRNGASGDSIPVEVEALGILDKIAGALNIKFDGRYLFSGSKTNTQPVASIHTSNLDSDNLATDNYYRGDNEVPSVRSSDSEITEYGLLANDDAFKNLIGAAHMLIAGSNADNDTTIGAAMDMVTTSIDQLATARATAITAVNSMNKANSTHGDFKLFIQANMDNISKTDIVAATSDSATLTANISASYMVLSKMLNLQLTNYLK